MSKKPLIFQIKGNSLDDGPGIRTAIFFKGCPLSCVWCHNPESKRPDYEISYNQDECIECNACVDMCSKDALNRGNPYFIDRDTCDLCFECVSGCYSGALEKVGRYYETQELIEIVKRDIPFFRTSNGGVTLTGGEPMMYMNYVSNICKELKKLDLNILIETSGHFDFSKFENLILPYIDTIYIDLKIIDNEKHKKFCGISNETILKNFASLLKKCRQTDKLLLPRIPLIPDITAKHENIQGIARFLKDSEVDEVEVLQYNPLWFNKIDKLGKECDYNERSWMNKHTIEEIKQLISSFEIKPL